MRRLGFHVSLAGGLAQLPPRAVYRHCTALQMFTSSPSQWAQPPLDPAAGQALAATLAGLDIRPHFVHALYLVNLASPDRALRRRSVRCLAVELQRAAQVGAAGVVVHLGSRGVAGRLLPALRRLARSLEEARVRAGQALPLLLENSAGAGGTVGSTLAELAEVFSLAPAAEPLRLCLDTAHAFAAGLPLHTPEGLEEVLTGVDALPGDPRLALVHLNDSRHPFASRRDRHWHLGQGHLGRAALGRIVNHPRLREIPLIMETPGTAEDDRRNMRVLRRLLPPEERPPLRRLRSPVPSVHITARRTET